MKPLELIKQLEEIYNWDLQPSEKEIMISLARKHGAGLLIKKWTEYQNRFPGHSVFKFSKNWVVQNEIEFF
jgi:hypothetical protein